MNEYKYTNRLVHEKSPYLLQHAHNPVDWYPWSDEAFEKAEKENKPIFLSIGYSTCHWCHVMEHESFEDEEVAGMMNDTFVSIKVDREERPDIDNIYMTVCQMMTGGGGWPLSVVMTPDKKPFFSGTYFPKEDRYGRIGFKNLIKQIDDVWKSRKMDVYQSAEKITDHLKEFANTSRGDEPTEEAMHAAFEDFHKRFDKEHGGFGSAPKFPSAQNLMFLLRYWKRTGDQRSLEMVEKTLTEMRMGGMFDHVGYGFHRYSTDESWLLPHFEKMLYDQAMLVMAYTEAYQATGKDIYKKTADEVISYVLRDMTADNNAFYSAEDADSEGEEGKFYIWTTSEIDHLLEEKDALVIRKVFNLVDEGNFADESTRNLTGANILHLVKDYDDMAADFDMNKTGFRAKIDQLLQRLYDYRETRVKPRKDDKILTDWNGLMIAALAKAGKAFGNREYIDAAMRAYEFIDIDMVTADGKLLHRYRDDEAAIKGNLDDYAFIIFALFELYEATAEFEYLDKAYKYSNIVLDEFLDEENGGFFFTPKSEEATLLRKKELFDAAIPSGNSIMMLNLVKLSRITGKSEFEKFAVDISRTASNFIKNSPTAFTQMLNAVDFLTGVSAEIIITGNAAQSLTDISQLFQTFYPNKVTMFVENENSGIMKIAEYLSDYESDGDIKYYVCKDYKCSLPVSTVDEALAILKELN
ncbi:MAG: thioredoxin domain-containing protein [Melioribacteraceae bacterium]|nr:MAG: thioredoxin domain-containing protein [Melioribacteraceae bacterium]